MGNLTVAIYVVLAIPAPKTHVRKGWWWWWVVGWWAADKKIEGLVLDHKRIGCRIGLHQDEKERKE